MLNRLHAPKLQCRILRLVNEKKTCVITDIHIQEQQAPAYRMPQQLHRLFGTAQRNALYYYV